MLPEKYHTVFGFYGKLLPVKTVDGGSVYSERGEIYCLDVALEILRQF